MPVLTACAGSEAPAAGAAPTANLNISIDQRLRASVTVGLFKDPADCLDKLTARPPQHNAFVAEPLYDAILPADEAVTIFVSFAGSEARPGGQILIRSTRSLQFTPEEAALYTLDVTADAGVARLLMTKAGPRDERLPVPVTELRLSGRPDGTLKECIGEIILQSHK